MSARIKLGIGAIVVAILGGVLLHEVRAPALKIDLATAERPTWVAPAAAPWGHDELHASSAPLPSQLWLPLRFVPLATQRPSMPAPLELSAATLMPPPEYASVMPPR